jgi:hypothetical protein
MPLLDHFHPPLSQSRNWEGFHSRWASALSDFLNAGRLPENLFAEPTIDVQGPVEIDVATLEPVRSNGSKGGRAAAVLERPTRTRVAPTWVIPAAFPDSFEVRVIDTEGGPKLVAAIELVSPANKDRPQHRRMFCIKCASYLAQGIHLIIIDVVTSRRANLHNEIMDLMETADFHLPAKTGLYATAYRPVRRQKREVIDAWAETFKVGDTLPRLPLFVRSDVSVTVDFEQTYQETRDKLRLSD